MHKALIGAAAGLALLVTTLLTLDANAATLTSLRLFRPWLAGADGWGAQRQHSEEVDPTDALVTARAPLERHHACHVQRMRASSFAKSTIVTGKDGSVGAADT
jgi:hypothetical protein